MNQWLAFGTVWSFFVATVSVAFAILSHRRQVNASVYLELSKQLHDLYKRMPQPRSSDDEMSETTRSLVFDSLQLIRSAFTLAATGYFTGRLWTVLRNDAEKALRKTAFRDQWPVMKVEFVSDPAFTSYVDRVQSS